MLFPVLLSAGVVCCTRLNLADNLGTRSTTFTSYWLLELQKVQLHHWPLGRHTKEDSVNCNPVWRSYLKESENQSRIHLKHLLHRVQLRVVGWRRGCDPVCFPADYNRSEIRCSAAPIPLYLSLCLQQPQGRAALMNNAACMYKSLSKRLTKRQEVLFFLESQTKGIFVSVCWHSAIFCS